MNKNKFLCGLMTWLMLFPLLSVLPVRADGEKAAADPDWPTRADGSRPTGEADDPYLIEDAADLLAFRAKRTDKTVGANNYRGRVIVLTADIDLNPGWSAGSLIAPPVLWGEFYDFSGTLDGRGHTVRGLYYSGSTYIGFIRNGTDCTIRNLTVDNSAFLASGNVCGLIATLKGTSHINGVRIGKDFYISGKSSVGGLVGNAYTGTGHTIVNCTVSGTVLSAEGYAGGLLGDTYQGSAFLLENCLSDGTVRASGVHAGGLVGNISKQTELRNCAAFGTVAASDRAGGLIGRSAGAVQATDCLSAGTVTAEHAAGIIGLCRGKVTFTRIVSVATYPDCSGSAEFLTEYADSDAYKEAEKRLTDCYGLSENCLLFTNASGALSPADIIVSYEETEAAAFRSLSSRSELPEQPAFAPDGHGYFGWTVHEGCLMPLTVRDLFTGHDFTVTQHPATCLHFNATDYLCSTCGYAYTETGYQKAEHMDADDWIYDPEPTDTVGGKRYRICDVCESIFNVEFVPAEGAVYQPTPDWGKNSNRLFTISSAADLLAFAAKRTAYSSYRNARVVLTADIDLNPGWDAASGLRPANVLTYLFDFGGILDGQGHTISGIYLEGNPQNNDTYACLFGKLTDATVCNLKITNSCFRTQANYAGLFGAAQGHVTLENLYADIIVESAKYAGGILTQINADSEVTMRNTVFTGQVTAGQYVGGLIGWDAGQTVTLTDCASYGTVSAPNGNVGALIGQISGRATLLRCLASGAVNGKGLSAGILTTNKPKFLSITDCYTDAPLSALPAIDGSLADPPTYAYGDETVEVIRTVSDVTEAAERLSDWIVSQDAHYAIPAALRCQMDGHSYSFTVTSPTCSARGFTTGICSVCGNQTVTDYTDPVDHIPNTEWIIDSPATETRMGSRHLTCSVCGETLRQEILPKLPAKEEPNSTAGDASSSTQATGESQKHGCSSDVRTDPVILLIRISLPALLILLHRKRRKS